MEMIDLIAKAKLEDELGHSLERDQLVAAVIAAQQSMRISEDAKGNRNSYSSIEEITSKTQPNLRQVGLWMDQGHICKDGHIYVYSKLIHVSGQWTRSLTLVPQILLREINQSEANSFSQGLGTITTYIKRYHYGSMLGLIIGENDPDSAPTDDKKSYPATISQEQYQRLLAGFQKYPGLEEELSAHFNLKNIKWLYASRWQEAQNVIKEFCSKKKESNAGVHEER